MLVRRPSGTVPATLACSIRRVRAVSCSQAPCSHIDTRSLNTTVVSSGSRPTTRTSVDRQASKGCGLTAHTLGSGEAATWVQRRPRSMWHSRTCSWTRGCTQKRDEACPGCQRETAAEAEQGGAKYRDSENAPYRSDEGKTREQKPGIDFPFELSPREERWRSRMDAFRRAVEKDPYEAVFGWSNRLRRGEGYSLAFEALLGCVKASQTRAGERSSTSTSATDSSHVSTSPAQSGPNATNQQAPSIKDASAQDKPPQSPEYTASMSWASSGSVNGNSWSKSGERLYDPITMRMVPKAEASQDTLGEFGNVKGNEQDVSTEQDVPIPVIKSGSARRSVQQKTKGSNTDAQPQALPGLSKSVTVSSDSTQAKKALERGWAAEVEAKSQVTAPSATSNVAEKDADDTHAARMRILDMQQREWESQLLNAERTAAAKHAVSSSAVSRHVTVTPADWKAFKAGTLRESKKMSSPSIHYPGRYISQDMRAAYLSIFRKEQPLKLMSWRQLNNHKAALVNAMTKKHSQREAASKLSAADIKLDDEVKAQKAAMTKFEGQRRLGTDSITRTAPTPEESINNPNKVWVGAEGDMDIKVARFAQNGKWYKDKAPQASLHEEDQRQLEQRRNADLAREIKDIYEGAYGAIDASVKQQMQETTEEAAFERQRKSMTERVAALDAFKRPEAESIARTKITDSRSQKGAMAGSMLKSRNLSEPYVTRVEPAIDRITRNQDRGAKLESAIERMSRMGTLSSKSSGAREEESAQSRRITSSESTEKKDPASRVIARDHHMEDDRVQQQMCSIDASRAGQSENALPEDCVSLASSRGGKSRSEDLSKKDQQRQVPKEQTAAVQDDAKARRGHDAVRHVQRVETVFSGARLDRNVSIADIVAHFHARGLGPQLAAEAKKSERAHRALCKEQSKAERRGGRVRDEQDEVSNSRKQASWKPSSWIVSLVSVGAASYAIGVMVEYFREAPPLAVEDDNERGWTVRRNRRGSIQPQSAKPSAAQASTSVFELLDSWNINGGTAAAIGVLALVWYLSRY